MTTENEWKLPYEPPTPEELAALKRQHGEIYRVGNDHAKVWIKRPGKAAYRAYKADRDADDERHANAPEALMRTLLVHPSQEKLDVVLDRFPAFADTCVTEILKLAGAGAKAEATKS